MRVLSFFRLASSVFCFCRSLFSVSFRTSNEENARAFGTILRALMLMLMLMLMLQRRILLVFVQKQSRFLTCQMSALSALLYFPGFFPSKDPVVFARFDDAGKRVSGLAAFAVAPIEQLRVQRPVRVRL